MIDYSNLSNATSLLNITKFVNQQTNGMFGAMFTLMIFVIFLIALSRYDNQVAFLGSSFITALFALLFYIAGIGSFITLFIIIILVVIGLVASMLKK